MTTPPMRSTIRTKPVRVQFALMSVITIREPLTRTAAAMWKAAEDGSPGTWIAPSSSSSCWVSSIRSPSRVIRQPERASRRSVWSRLGSGSITVVVPEASRPAISTHDLTCAEATGSVYSIPRSGMPCTVNGGEAALVRVDPRAHLAQRRWRRGRRAGGGSTRRRRSVHSPPGWPASQPGASRISVPALPTSMCASRGRRAAPGRGSSACPGRRPPRPARRARARR